jgi:hypothetical protein
MDEKILLLMEETNCDQAEAELAMELANYDLEKAVKTIRSILRNIIVTKGKFIITGKNIYGLFIMILDKRFQSVIRLRCVTSYNPMIYEYDLDTEWDQVERLIYRCRLIEGSILSFARNVEDHFNRTIDLNKDKFFKALNAKNFPRIKELFTDNFPLGVPEILLATEEINLAAYQDGSNKAEPEKMTDISSTHMELTKIVLEVSLSEDRNGKKASSLSKGDIVLAQITDSREIAKYLTRLLCSKAPNFLPVSIEEIKAEDSEIEVSLHFTPRIVGSARLKANTRVKVLKEVSNPWWRRIFPWWG